MTGARSLCAGASPDPPGAPPPRALGRRACARRRTRRPAREAPSRAAPGTASSSSARERSGRRCRRCSATGASSARGTSRRSARGRTSRERSGRAAPARPPPDELAGARRGRAADGRRRVPHGRRARDALGRAGRGVRGRAGRGEDVGPGVPPAQEPRLEPRRPRPLQPRREPQGRRGAVRVPRDVHHAAVGPRARPSTCRSARRCASTRARRTVRGCCRCSLPVQRAAESCAWLKRDGGRRRDLPPAALDAAEAFRLLTDLPRLEAAGVIVRVPGDWRAGRPPRPQVTRHRRRQAAGGLGADALLDFSMEVTLDGERLTAAEVAALLAGSTACSSSAGAGSRSIASELAPRCSRVPPVERAAAERGLTLRRGDAHARRRRRRRPTAPPRRRPRLVARRRRPLARRHPRGAARARRPGARRSGDELRATLRPYQRVGVRWLYLLSRLGLGACLADDMGLGKTIQVLSLLLVPRRRSATGERRASLLVAPASLLANWRRRSSASRPSCGPGGASLGDDRRRAATHSTRGPLPGRRPGHHQLRLAPARALAGPNALAAGRARRGPGDQESRRQADARGQAARRAGRGSRSPARRSRTASAICGRSSTSSTPACSARPGVHALHEAPGRAAAQPVRAAARAGAAVHPAAAEDRPTVIADLPDKTEVKAYCLLSRKQAALYQQAVDELARAARARRGHPARASSSRS